MVQGCLDYPVLRSLGTEGIARAYREIAPRFLCIPSCSSCIENSYTGQNAFAIDPYTPIVEPNRRVVTREEKRANYRGRSAIVGISITILGHVGPQCIDILSVTNGNKPYRVQLIP